MSSDSRERRASRLAASFVVVVAGACTKSSVPPEPRPEAQASIATQLDGSCRYYQSMSCPENATCNPPPPRELDCPRDKRAENSRVLPEHDQRPAGKEGWLRFHESFWVGNQSCSYTGDQLCPPPGKQGSCVGAKSIEIPCPAQSGEQLPRSVPAFKAERAAGGCVAYPEFRCESAGCKLPAPAFIDCSAELPSKRVEPAPPAFQGSVSRAGAASVSCSSARAVRRARPAIRRRRSPWTARPSSVTRQPPSPSTTSARQVRRSGSGCCRASTSETASASTWSSASARCPGVPALATSTRTSR